MNVIYRIFKFQSWGYDSKLVILIQKIKVKKEIAYVMLFVFFLLSIGPMSHVDFKKYPCRRVEFRGPGHPLRKTGWFVFFFKAYSPTWMLRSRKD